MPLITWVTYTTPPTRDYLLTDHVCSSKHNEPISHLCTPMRVYSRGLQPTAGTLKNEGH